MKQLTACLFHDEAGFIVSSELVLIATLLVIGLIVGLSEVQHSIVSELNDVSEAVGGMNQSYRFSGFHSYKSQGKGVKAIFAGSSFRDQRDECDNNECDLDCLPPAPEKSKGGGHGHY
jgi:Flp pilus assembly pilin Flp